MPKEGDVNFSDEVRLENDYQMYEEAIKDLEIYSQGSNAIQNLRRKRDRIKQALNIVRHFGQKNIFFCPNY